MCDSAVFTLTSEASAIKLLIFLREDPVRFNPPTRWKYTVIRVSTWGSWSKSRSDPFRHDAGYFHWYVKTAVNCSSVQLNVLIHYMMQQKAGCCVNSSCRGRFRLKSHNLFSVQLILLFLARCRPWRTVHSLKEIECAVASEMKQNKILDGVEK